MKQNTGVFILIEGSPSQRAIDYLCCCVGTNIVLKQLGVIIYIFGG